MSSEGLKGEELISNGYSADSIQVLEGLEAVRMRPSMYIGDTSIRGLHHLVYEVVDNSIDEALAGFCNRIDVTINEDGSITVVDNGRGIPVDYHEKEKKSALEVVLTVLHAGGKFDKGSYKVSGGLHGVGVSCVNALSIKLVAEVMRDGKLYRQEFSMGKPVTSLEVVGESPSTGTIITFMPDSQIFTQSISFNFEIIASRLRELAFLNKGIRLTLTDKRELVENGEAHYRHEEFYSVEGLKEFIKFLDGNRESLTEKIIYIESDKGDVPVEEENFHFLGTVGVQQDIHIGIAPGSAIQYRMAPPGLRVQDGRVLVNHPLPGFTLRYTTDDSEPTV
ncbi:MAG TPA: ATP-binding protein, partial [Tenuifilaceae bacterium]|nr:ATP-binding protein [Tenuifilaceae bacterium]